MRLVCSVLLSLCAFHIGYAADFSKSSDIRTFGIQFLPEITSSDLNYCSALFDAVSSEGIGDQKEALDWFNNLIKTIPSQPNTVFSSVFVLRDGKFEADVTAEDVFDSNDSAEFIASRCARWAGEVYSMASVKPREVADIIAFSERLGDVSTEEALNCLAIGGAGFVDPVDNDAKALFGAIIHIYGQKLHENADAAVSSEFLFFGKSDIWDAMQQGGFSSVESHDDFDAVGNLCLEKLMKSVSNENEASE